MIVKLNLDITPFDLEKIIDTFEKITKIESNQSCKFLVEQFPSFAKKISPKITPQVLETVY